MIAVVTLTRDKEPKRLRDLLWTLTHQSVLPAQVIVVDGNRKPAKTLDTYGAVEPFEDRVIQFNVIAADMPEFSLSRGFNIGIKRTREDVDYVLTTGVDMLFGENVIEMVLSKLDRNSFCVSHCGFLVEDVEVKDDVFSHWDSLCKHIHPNPPVKISTGAMIAAPRKWWFDNHGYDEINYPFALADSDVTMRMKLTGLSPAAMSWAEGQILHVWHEYCQLIPKLGGAGWPNERMGLNRNPKGWGEI